MRAVLDVNVLVAAVLAPHGVPASLLRRFLAGEYEIVLSEQLGAELERALEYPKLRRRVDASEAARFAVMLRAAARTAADPAAGPSRSPDPGDDYLLALAEQEQAMLVSGDPHLLALAPDLPVLSPRAFFDLLDRG